MNNNAVDNKEFNRRVIDIAIKLSALAVVLVWCFEIVKPFLLLIIWGGILAVALYPLHVKLTKLLKGKKSLASTVISIISIALIVVPSVQLSSSSIDSAQHLYNGIHEGTLKIPQPTESIKEWPVIGEKSYALWLSASQDLEKVAGQYSEQIKNVSGNLVSAAMGIGGTIVQFLISLIIATVFMAKSDSCHKGISLVMQRLMGESGERTIDTTIATIKSVATGVLGVALIQSLLAGGGLMVAGIPGAGVWAMAVLLLAIAQLPPILVLGPIAAYYFSVADTTPAVLFLIWSLIVSASDAFLKPLFLGRGMDIPMLVILIGAIGGMLVSGIIGLFVGSVVLAIGYQLMMDWLAHNPAPTTNESE